MFGSGIINLQVNGNAGLTADCIIPGLTSLSHNTLNLILYNNGSGSSVNLVTIGEGTYPGSKLATLSADCIIPMPEYGIINCTLYGPSIGVSGIMNMYMFSSLLNSGTVDCYSIANGISNQSAPLVISGF